MQLDDLDFADDLALLFQTQQQMQEKTNSVAAASAAYGGSDADVKARICKARAAYLQLKNIWNSKQLSTNTKDDIGCTAAELVYGTTLTLPGQLFKREPTTSEDPSRFLSRLLQMMQNIKAIPPREHNNRVHLDKHLEMYKFVFVRVDAVKKPLTPPYEGPYKVIKRTNKYFITNKSGNNETISIDQIKPAFYEVHQDTEDNTANKQSLPSIAKKQEEEEKLSTTHSFLTRSGRLIKKPKRYVHFAV
ncbi:unnamed protein product [Schistosoma margrebowiei]|uniref:Uncharacterized protein n=1 Tax=Schistosoma margrebowiei TaxID=48269 RepID=A0A183MYN9_9TREM|nr:unnamed protein product [Schistosoma margrebowiei]